MTDHRVDTTASSPMKKEPYLQGLILRYIVNPEL